MIKAKSLSVRKSRKDSKPVEDCWGRQKTACLRSKNKRKQVTDWVTILKQIQDVTNKVKKLCHDSDKNNLYRSRAKSRNIQILNLHQNQCSTQYINYGYQGTQAIQIDNPQKFTKVFECNSACHQLMYKCKKLNKQKKFLQKQKQALEKRLYYQSKEKRELRWKLERQRQRQRAYFQFDDVSQNMENNSFTLRLSSNKNILNSHFDPNKMDQISYLTAKKPSPLKQKSRNIVIKSNSASRSNKISNKQNYLALPLPSREQSSDSLLIDMSIEKQKEKGLTEQSKMSKSISLQKDLNELLEICKLETDKTKKKIIRKQMQRVAQEIKKLRMQ